MAGARTWHRDSRRFGRGRRRASSEGQAVPVREIEAAEASAMEAIEGEKADEEGVGLGVLRTVFQSKKATEASRAKSRASRREKGRLRS